MNVCRYVIVGGTGLDLTPASADCPRHQTASAVHQGALPPARAVGGRVPARASNKGSQRFYNHGEGCMFLFGHHKYSNLPIGYDLCGGIPISHLLTTFMHQLA